MQNPAKNRVWKPHKCSKTACAFQAKLQKKWNPEEKDTECTLSKEERALIADDTAIIFNMNFTTRDSLKNGFQVFADLNQLTSDDMT